MKNIIPSSNQSVKHPVIGDERLPQRFWDKIRVAEGGCWEWTAQIGHHGYARIHVDGRSQKAHRVAYTALVGAIPAGFVVDHLCRVRHCVNPARLEPVTNKENLRRGTRESFVPCAPNAGVISNAVKTHCPQGHQYAGENLGMNTDGSRYCRTCKSAQSRVSRARRRASVEGGVR